MKKRVLIYAHYYYPDVASTAQLLKEQAEGMTAEFDVTVICVVPSYDGHVDETYKKKKYYFEEINGVHVVRVRVPEFSKTNKVSRIKNIVAYFFRALKATGKVGKQDYIFTISQPPILGGLVGVWGKWLKHAKLIYCIQDFNPEQTLATGFTKSKWIIRAMMAADKFSCRHSDLVVTVGRDLVDTLKNRFKGKKVPNHVMINNWIDEKNIYPLVAEDEGVKSFKKKYGLENKFVIMYSGNIGLYYDLENIIRVIGEFKSCEDVVFAFVGDGTMKQKLMDYVQEKQIGNVVFIPYQPKEELIYSLNAADVHWCVNAKGIKGVSCPSKYYGIAAAGKPVLAVLESGSEVRLIIEETKGGLVCEPGDYKSIKENIAWFIANREKDDLKQMGQRSREYLEKNLTKEVSIGRYMEEISGL